MPHDQAYLLAEKKIEEAQRSGAMELHLGSMELTEISGSLGQLTQLRSLDLSNNHLVSLPESLSNLKQLEFF